MLLRKNTGGYLSLSIFPAISVVVCRNTSGNQFSLKRYLKNWFFIVKLQKVKFIMNLYWYKNNSNVLTEILNYGSFIVVYLNLVYKRKFYFLMNLCWITKKTSLVLTNTWKSKFLLFCIATQYTKEYYICIIRIIMGRNLFKVGQA